MRRMYSKNQLAQEVQNVVSSGELENVKVFEDIVDKDGHKRFIEGTLKDYDSLPSGITATYKKWSLSGSHLLIVYAGTLAENTSLSGPTNWASLEDFPKWIFDKIYPIFSNQVSFNTINAYASNWSTQSIQMVLGKDSVNQKLVIQASTSAIISANRNFRVAFDLLIDNE